MNGILNVYKERGFTSHDVVAKLRGITHQKKIGHTGTLDPEAEGVLLVCFGNATKVCDLIEDRKKQYRVVCLLGCQTDTQDLTGEVLNEKPVTCTEEEIRLAANSFVGKYMQVPPMYSALKVNGKRLYELAREGKTVERKAREIEIYSIAVEQIDLVKNEVTMLVSCSKGTYIRTLCDDLGTKLGCGGTMKSLLRTAVGEAKVNDAVKLSQVEAWMKEGELEDHLVSVRSLFSEVPSVRVTETFEHMLKNGNPLPANAIAALQGKRADRICVEDASGTFLGLYAWDAKRRMYFPEKMFL
ncbi:MAG: tRNA pseudouridine(55) synthase TruB [Lachnospiraceae bacterium]|nr:tRNA pseudouridine(55) synthase TruB [Lachnospiraceae bacterium]